MGTSLTGETRAQGGDGAATQGSALGEQARPRTSTTRPYQRLANEDRGTGGESLADFLGVFSLGLGLAQVLAPEAMSKICGVADAEGNKSVMRALGAREISHGIAILSKQQPEKAVWSRVAGDALDLALLGKVMANPDNHRGRTLFATANVLAVTALDVMAARQLSMQPKSIANAGADAGIIRTKRSITVNRPVEEVYAFWHNFENFPQFMRHLESVRMTGNNRSHWVAKAPAGQTVEWDADTIEDRPNELISWRSAEGAPVFNAGTVRFMPAPGARGTEVRVDLAYDPPFGKLGSKVAMLFREEPGQQVQDDLRHFKQVMETGEIVLSDATKQRGPHPAQPDTKPVQL
ncbi:MAG TPA: SRPBCC family protein [Gemmatimonadaceae bacterium]|nr:SRPBCC family protein [Gemmatimonadaceae bacterium]